MPWQANKPDFSKELTIVINEETPTLAAIFTVPQGLLVEHSAFFRAACRNEWKEATSRVIKLPELDKDTFHAYLYWIYNEEVVFDVDRERKEDVFEDEEYTYPTLNELTKLWILADRLMTAKLRNAVMDRLLSVLHVLDPGSDMHEVFPESIISYIWSKTLKDRALRRAVMDFYAYIVHPKMVESVFEEYHPDFVKDLALHGLKINQGLVSNTHSCEQKPGYYHELDKPHPCSNTGGHASVELRDEDGGVVHAQCTLFATPKAYLDLVHHEKYSHKDHVVSLQVGYDTWAGVKESSWGESFGKIAESNHFENVNIRITFDCCKIRERFVCHVPGLVYLPSL